ncbi:MAG: inositol-3-phosphate synthase [Myxococcales bacterium]|nr:inositol-3-phosphate synthase [Myxococcales bacterium]
MVGARGSISATVVAGHAALVAGEASPTGLVTARPPFVEAELPTLDRLVFGGHEIRGGSLLEEARAVLAACGVPGLADRHAAALEAVEARIRPGVVRGGGAAIDALATERITAKTDAEAVAVIRADIDAFKASVGAEHVVVVNVASTEPAPAPHPSWGDLDALVEAMNGEASVLPASALYAYAALDGGHGHVNFTPSVGSRLPALAQLAERRGALHAGSDGKTGETLVKSVLAELFVRRNLAVQSWFGQNILGNMDGAILDNPANKATKLHSKDHLIARILGPQVESRVGIDYVRSLGETKIAWDHIHFEGFLGGRMSLQFTWTGVDSLLAAPLVLDLVRLVAFAAARGESGLLGALAPFFKDPMGTDEQRLISQDDAMVAWLKDPRAGR